MTRPAELPPTVPMLDVPPNRPVSPVRTPQYHYTSLAKLKSILREGRIRTSAWRRDGHLIVRAAWTSTAPIWEPTASATSVITGQWEFAVEELLSGATPPIARIGVATDDLHDWSEHLAEAGVADAYIWHLAECGFECGANPDDWAVCPQAIPSAVWRGIDVWNGDGWISIATSDHPEKERNILPAPPHGNPCSDLALLSAIEQGVRHARG